MFLGKGILATIGVVAYFVILVCTIWSCFDYSICDKRNYEFAKIDGIEYVVLSKKEGSLVLVEVQGEDNELGSHYVFCVDKYLLFNKNEVVLEWKNLYNEPEIKKLYLNTNSMIRLLPSEFLVKMINCIEYKKLLTHS